MKEGATMHGFGVSLKEVETVEGGGKENLGTGGALKPFEKRAGVQCRVLPVAAGLPRAPRGSADAQVVPSLPGKQHATSNAGLYDLLDFLNNGCSSDLRKRAPGSLGPDQTPGWASIEAGPPERTTCWALLEAGPLLLFCCCSFSLGGALFTVNPCWVGPTAGLSTSVMLGLLATDNLDPTLLRIESSGSFSPVFAAWDHPSQRP